MGLTISSVPVKRTNLTFLKSVKTKKTKTTGEAMVLLEHVHRKLILLARQVARSLTVDGGTTTCRDVLKVMVEEGMYEPNGDPAYWLGAVFRGKGWEWTGQYAQFDVPRTAKNTHAWRTVKIWKRK